MDSYHPIFDAVRSRLTNCDVSQAIESAIREANLSHYVQMAGQAAIEAASEYTKPSVVFKPRIMIDGNQWCALYGDNLQDGVAGFGKSPAEAMREFDRAWYAELEKEPR